jgi:hypothetical protein
MSRTIEAIARHMVLPAQRETAQADTTNVSNQSRTTQKAFCDLAILGFFGITDVAWRVPKALR